MQDVNTVVDLVFADADAAHRQHLATQSYAEHMALGSFYSDVRDGMDALAESLIALGQRPEPAPRAILDQLRDSFRQLGDLRSVCDGVPAVENLFDNVSATYLSAIYRLERLVK
jgi:DNA-binding ferritin-like protein